MSHIPRKLLICCRQVGIRQERRQDGHSTSISHLQQGIGLCIEAILVGDIIVIVPLHVQTVETILCLGRIQPSQGIAHTIKLSPFHRTGRHPAPGFLILPPVCIFGSGIHRLSIGEPIVAYQLYIAGINRISVRAQQVMERVLVRVVRGSLPTDCPVTVTDIKSPQIEIHVIGLEIGKGACQTRIVHTRKAFRTDQRSVADAQQIIHQLALVFLRMVAVASRRIVMEVMDIHLRFHLTGILVKRRLVVYQVTAPEDTGSQGLNRIHLEAPFQKVLNGFQRKSKVGISCREEVHTAWLVEQVPHNDTPVLGKGSDNLLGVNLHLLQSALIRSAGRSESLGERHRKNGRACNPVLLCRINNTLQIGNLLFSFGTRNPKTHIIEPYLFSLAQNLIEGHTWIGRNHFVEPFHNANPLLPFPCFLLGPLLAGKGREYTGNRQYKS